MKSPLSLVASTLKRHLLTRLIIPVSAIALGAVITSMALSWSAYLDWSRDDVMDDDAARLVQASGALSAFHNWLIPYVRSLRKDPDLVPLFSDSEPSLYDSVRALDRIDDAWASGRSLHSLYAYNGVVGFFLSTSHGLQDIDVADPEVRDLVGQSATYRPYRYHPRLVDGDRVLSMIVGDLPGTGGRPLSRALVVNIDLQGFASDYFAGIDRRGTFVVIDGDRRELYRSGESREFQNLAGVFQDSGSVIVRNSQRHYGVSWLHNSDLDWWLVVESDLELSLKNAGSQRMGVLAVILALLGLALAVTYRAAFGLYRPVLSLLPHLTGTIPPTESGGGSVYSEISRSMQRLGDRLEEESARKDRERLRDYLEDALTPKDTTELRKRIPDILTVSPPWRVVAISMKDSFGRASETVEYLILGEDEVVQGSALAPYAGAGRSVGVGNPAASSADLPRSARQARTALGHRFYLGTGQVIFFSEIRDDPEEPYDLPQRSVRRLVEKLNTGHTNAAGEELAAILDDIKGYRPEDFRMTVSFLAYELRRDLLPLSELEPGFGALVDAQLEEILSSETLHEVQERFLSLFEATQARQEARSDQKDERVLAVVGRMRSIMDRDLGDSGLCPDSIASEIGLSTSYARSLYKQIDGQSLSRAIQDRRMAECKRLLMETDMSVKDIAEATGHRNYNSFFSTFRRVVGLTPMVYRDARRETSGN